MGDDWEKKIRRNAQQREDLLEERDRLVAAANADGVPVTRIAEWLGLHRTHVHRIIRAHAGVSDTK